MKYEFKIEKTDATPRVFVLMWNPAISSYTMERFENDLQEMVEWGESPDDFDWSVWEWEKAHEGDHFFMVRVGEGNTGIVMAGTFTSDPYEGEDWSGRGRKTYYMQMELDAMIHPDRSPIITTEQLMKEIPEFDWTKGHSGQLLDIDTGAKLATMWRSYINENKAIFQPRAAVRKYFLDFLND